MKNSKLKDLEVLSLALALSHFLIVLYLIVNQNFNFLKTFVWFLLGSFSIFLLIYSINLKNHKYEN